MNALLQDLLNGETRALAKVITQVENRSAGSFDILRELFPHTGRARVIGMTGSPGAGKSSLVNRLTAVYRQKDKQIGIVAVDPTSPFTGGAILGDRIRMQQSGVDSGVYIRSMATRGNLGGLAAATADVVSVLDAAGRDPIIVETVGVGQDEIEIVKLADISIVMLVPGMGDDVQALKAGIMEIADIYVINKCDRPGVEKMERAITTMLSLAHPQRRGGTVRLLEGREAAYRQDPDGGPDAKENGWVPPIVKTTATTGSGVDELIAEIDRYFEFMQAAPRGSEKKLIAARQRLLSLLEERMMRTVLDKAFGDEVLARIVADIADRKQDPYTVVERLCRSITLESQ